MSDIQNKPQFVITMNPRKETIEFSILDFLGRLQTLVFNNAPVRRNYINPYPTAFPYGNGMVLHFYQQQESSTTKTVHKVINKRLKMYV